MLLSTGDEGVGEAEGEGGAHEAENKHPYLLKVGLQTAWGMPLSTLLQGLVHHDAEGARALVVLRAGRLRTALHPVVPQVPRHERPTRVTQLPLPRLFFGLPPERSKRMRS